MPAIVETLSTPSLTVIGPANELLPLSVSVPTPVLVKPGLEDSPSSQMTALISKSPSMAHCWLSLS